VAAVYRPRQWSLAFGTHFENVSFVREKKLHYVESSSFGGVRQRCVFVKLYVVYVRTEVEGLLDDGNVAGASALVQDVVPVLWHFKNV
jgi:hypothetical protein